MDNKLLSIPVESDIFLWVNSDLDGVGSAILLSHIFPNFEYSHVFFGKFQESYLKWVKKNYNRYDRIFIVGFPLSQEFINKIDDQKVVIINDKGDNFKTWESIYIDEPSSSCSKLIYKKFKDKIEFSKEVKRLILYIDDYNSQELKYEESKYLNSIYRTFSLNRFSLFFERFKNGYDGITQTEEDRHLSYMEEIDHEASILDIYQGFWRDKKVIGVVTKMPVNEISQELFKHYKCDFILILNPDTNFVSFRRPKTSDVDVSQIALMLCGGGGSPSVAGGQLTKTCMDYLQKLEKPIYDS